MAVILLDYDGVNPARLVETPPAPQPGEAQHYGEFITRLTSLYVTRF